MRIEFIGMALFALAGCNQPAADSRNTVPIEETGISSTANAANPDLQANADAAADNLATAAAAPDGKIPPAFQGRWGLVPADCSSTRGDNKGLMTVEADRLSFYESRATIAKLSVVSPTELNATLNFSGEGQTWQQETPLILAAEGGTLTRMADGQALRYARCAT